MIVTDNRIYEVSIGPSVCLWQSVRLYDCGQVNVLFEGLLFQFDRTLLQTAFIFVIYHLYTIVLYPYTPDVDVSAFLVGSLIELFFHGNVKFWLKVLELATWPVQFILSNRHF